MPSRSSSVCNDVWRWGSAPPLDTAFLSSTETGAGFKRPTFMRVLISGAGIAGPTLAYWLAHYGFTPTIVEKAPRLRTGGYIIDFWGAGFEIADRMGLLPEIRRKGYTVQELRVVNQNGERMAGFPVEAFFRAAGGRYISLPRSELAASIFGTIDGKVEAMFGNTVTRIEQKERTVRVAFERGPEREFDLVIGADGLHSEIRELVFGAQDQFEKYLVMYTEVHQQVGRFTMRGDRTLFLFTWADSDPAPATLGRSPTSSHSYNTDQDRVSGDQYLLVGIHPPTIGETSSAS